MKEETQDHSNFDGLHSYTKKSWFFFLSEVILQLKACLVLPFVTKLFGAADYGIWSQIEVFLSLLAPLIIMGLDSASIRFASGKPNKEIRQALSSVLTYTLGCCCLVGFALWSASEPLAISFFGGSQNASFVRLCVPALLAMMLISVSRTFLLTIGAAHLVALMRVCEGILLLVPLAWVLHVKSDLFHLVVGNIIVQCVICLASLLLLWYSLPLRRPDFALLVRYLRFGAVIMPAGYAVWILNLSDRFFISSFLGLTELGIYSAIYSLSYLVISLFFNPFWVTYPVQAARYYNEGRLDDLRGLYRHSTRLATLLVVPASVGLAVLGPGILALLTTPEFLPGAKLLLIISISYTLSMYGAYFSINLGLIEKPYLTTLTLLASAGFNIALNYLLIPKWGLLGAAVSTLGAFSLHFVLEWYLSRRYFLNRMGFDHVGAIKTIAGSLAMAFVLLSCGMAKPSSLLGLSGAVLVGAITYAVSQLIFHNLTGDELRQLFTLVGLSGITKRFPLDALITFLDRSAVRNKS